MKSLPFALLISLTAAAATAEETRQLDAHEHGVGQLDIAFDGSQIAIELRAPGADIVGFEYAAESTADRAKTDSAVAMLARPLDLFSLPEAAGCSVVQASAELESQEALADHDEKHAHDDHTHDEHAHEDHAEHTDEDHAAHSDEAGHTEFHAQYLLNCADPAAASVIEFAYFATFPNALELEVQVISDTGASAFEVTRDAPVLDLRGMF
ncbi:zinc uptake protein ZrgA [Roseobacter ponti]|uniref:DUF2796 domain-containing protein n=1 Tax=Roseobacter ponti TaxID=1891787 RepID=A0A858SPF1_9RHOB|nr:DUF2796 domain-containing protein [Roseobacter ponti]QJF50654.1 DUF2796 domain-containing protein [Roseobacter ponti]